MCIIIGIFGCILMDRTNLGVMQAWYHVIRMWSMKSNSTCGFSISMFPMHYVTFRELS